ncbi:MAG: M36 family metallopeptidase [Planctomycetota bacterium]|nr:M36 family metallopeptidase [Planctomycetota bacterium]
MMPFKGPHCPPIVRATSPKAKRGRRKKLSARRALQVESLETRLLLEGAPVAATSNFVVVRDDGAGLFLHLGNSDNDPGEEFSSRFGFAESSPYTNEAHRILYGDMSGRGVDRPVAVQKSGVGLEWFVQDDDDTDVEYRFQFGLSPDLVLIRDFNGNLTDDVAVARPGRFDAAVGLRVYQWYVAYDPFRAKESGADGGLLSVDYVFEYGYDGDTLLVGDWNGDGKSEPGLVSQNTTVLGNQTLMQWYLDGVSFPFGIPPAKPVVGDWDGDGRDNVGVVEEYPGQPFPNNISLWLLHLNRDPHAEGQFRYGLPDDQYFTGQLDQPDILIDDVSVTEGDSGTGNLVFTVSLSHASQVPVTVDFTTSDYTASQGSDYNPVSGRLTFLPPTSGNIGETSKTINVPVKGDDLVEGAESFHLRLSNPVGARLPDNIGIGSIRDNDGALLSISDVVRNEGASGSTEFRFLISSTKPIDTPIEARLRTRDGTARGDSDYVPVDKTIVIPAGQLSTSSSVSVTGDLMVELDETFSVELSSIQALGRDVRPGNVVGTGTILNDDSAHFQVQVSNASARESLGQMPFIVTLSNPVDVETRVVVSTADGSASTADRDYQPLAQEVTFPAGVTERTVPVTINDDAQVELDETFFVNISGIQSSERAVNLGAGGQGVIVNDDFAIIEIISDVQRVEGDSGTTAFTFGVRLSNPVDAPIDVRFTTTGGAAAEGKATEGDDFRRVNDVISFSRGESGTRTISVDVIGDVVPEGDEFFFMNLADLHVHSRDVRMGADQRRGIIKDDDVMGSISGTKFEDSNGNGMRDQNETGLPNWTIFVDANGDGVLNSHVQVPVESTNIPVPIRDRTTSRSQLIVTGLVGPVGDVDLKLDITHTYVADLTATLISPLGTRVMLFSRVGGLGANFTNTILDDEAEFGIGEGISPFAGRFRPTVSLANLVGEDPNGIWTLEISDNELRDEGSLNSWSLDISTAVCDANAAEACTITDVNGEYVFRDLPAGSYQLVEVQQPGWRQTFPLGPNRRSSANTNAIGLGDGTAQIGGLYLPPQRRLVGGLKPLSVPSKMDALDVALEFLRGRATDLGLSESDFESFVVKDRYVSGQTGVTHLYLRQMHNGLEILNADINVNVSPQGEVLSVGSTFLPLSSVKNDLVPLVPLIDAESGMPELESYFGESLDAMSEAFPPELHYVPTPNGLELAWRLNSQSRDIAHWYDSSVSAIDSEVLYWTDWVLSFAEYNVFPLPVEHPEDGGRVLQASPHDPDASPLGWHDTNGVVGPEFTDTRGNNVFAQEDADANNREGFRPDGGGSLTFSFPLDLNGPPASYLPAAITNLFYWNNVLHDIHYQYGFDEAAGNFQQTNYSGAGAGGDPVMADAQDGSGTNNANIFVPPDGSPPRMQMYRWTNTTPERDSDFDNQVIIHEYGHGVSNRLTGGPSNSGALSALQSGGMGEGWSDWWALVLTAKPEDFSNPANQFPIGAYLLGQDSETGRGIRAYPYSFDMSIDPLTLGRFNMNSQVHFVGTIWASALWDLTWLLVNGDGGNIPAKGFDTDVYRGDGGNNVAMQLVMDAMKLQPANPSFLDARDAILLADQVSNGGANQLAIWTAFARRGMGASASDGGQANSQTVSEAFDLPLGSHVILLSPRQTVEGADFGNRREPVRISIAKTAAVVEGDQAEVLVSLGRPSQDEVRVNYHTVADSAVASSDFEPITGTLLFKPGEIRKTVHVPIRADGLTEPSEVLHLSLSSAENGLIVDGLSTITIVDDGLSIGLPTLAIAATDAVKSEGSSGSTAFIFAVTRTGLTTGMTSVDWAVTGSGTSPANAADFSGSTLPRGTLTFAAGEMTRTITVGVVGDMTLEPDEGIAVAISNASNAQITTAIGDVSGERFPVGAPLPSTLFAASARIPNVAIPLAFDAGGKLSAVAASPVGVLPTQAAPRNCSTSKIEGVKTGLHGSGLVGDSSEEDELIDVLAAATRRTSLAEDVDAVFGGVLWD